MLPLRLPRRAGRRTNLAVLALLLVAGGTGVLAYRGAMPLGYHDDPVRTAETYPVIDGVRYVMPGDYARVLGEVRRGLEWPFDSPAIGA